MNKSQLVKEYLESLFKEPKCELNFGNDFELLVAVILSAQCTDKRVNIVTEELFKDFKTPHDFLNISQEELEQKIRSCGFYKNKAKAIIETSKDLVEKFDGKLPKTREELQTLRGVGRKTANVVLSVLYDYPAIAVDTHVFRVSNRLGLSNSKDVTKCENDLMSVFKKEDWSKMHYLLVLFGRYFCKAIKPQCQDCKLKQICFYYNNKKEGKDVLRQSENNN